MEFIITRTDNAVSINGYTDQQPGKYKVETDTLNNRILIVTEGYRWEIDLDTDTITVNDEEFGGTPAELKTLLYSDVFADLGGSGDIEMPIYQRKTILTDAQIKALPTSIITVVPAQGAGKIIVPIAARCLLNPSAGVYGNATDASFSLCYNFDDDDSNAIMASSPIPAEAYLTATDIGLLTFMIPFCYPGQGMFSSAIVSDGFLNQSYANKPLAIFDRFSESLSEYTGGHEDNTLEVTILYSIVDL